MKKKFFLIILLLLIIAILTNPNLDKHREEVNLIYYNELEQVGLFGKYEGKMIRKFGKDLGINFVDDLSKRSIFKKSYLIFSITILKWKKETSIIGYGVFGNVFISREVFDNLNKTNFDEFRNYEVQHDEIIKL